MRKSWYTFLNPLSPSAQRACVKSAGVHSSAGSLFLIVSSLWCYRHAGFWLIPVPDRATQFVDCWQTASSILLNAHCYFALLRGGAECPSKKKKKVNETPQVGGDGVDGVERTTFDGVPEALVSSNPTVPNCLGMSILVKDLCVNQLINRTFKRQENEGLND